MDDYTVIDLNGLRKLGIHYTRVHIKRMMFEKRSFPVWFSLSNEPKARKVWWLREIVAWLNERGGKR